MHAGIGYDVAISMLHFKLTEGEERSSTNNFM
jgi:hypothetical protein